MSSASAPTKNNNVAVSVTENSVTSKTHKPESALKSFLSGGIGGVCLVFVGHPLDLVKVRMQTASAELLHASVGKLLLNTFKAEGVAGLYRGVSAPLLAVTPIFALNFWGYDMGQRIISDMQNTNDPLTIPQKIVAGGMSALPATVLMAPSERIKCLLQIDKTGKYNGFMDCASKVFKEGGIGSLYKGTGATLMRDVPGSMVWFGTYEFVKLSIMQMQGIEDMSKLSPGAVLTAGGLAGMACWTVAIPPDVLKSRYQTAPPGKYTGIFDVYRQLIKTEGTGALFAGMRPALLRAFPANAACFFGMEVSKKMLQFMD